MKKIIMSMAFALLTGLCFAQKTNKALHVGDQMPEYRFLSLINSMGASDRITAYKGKYLILDFWSTSCASCLEGFPHMQALQNKFKDKLNIILVNTWDHDIKEIIENTLTRINKNKGVKINLPIALYDPVLSNVLASTTTNATSYFPYQTLPHEVIIDPEGKIIAITSLEEIKDEKIEKLIRGIKVEFLDRDFFLDTNAPLIMNKNFLEKGNSSILVNSSLTGYGTKVANTEKFNDTNQHIGQCYTNTPLIFLYTMAYNKMMANTDATIYDTKDAVFQNPDENPSKLFCYDLILPAGMYTNDKLQECLRQDLDRAFGFRVTKEKRSLPCLILKTNKKISSIYTKYQIAEGNIANYKDAIKNHAPIYGHKYPIGFLSELINNKTFNKKAISYKDESGYDQDIDLDFPKNFDFTNKEAVLSFLHNKGIDYTIENRELDCVIISDKKPGDPTILP